jgi:Icc-related predicted phosphoesterase
MTRIVAISDTHGLHMRLSDIPDGDILIHTGDFCSHGSMLDCIKFFNWFGTKPHKHKIVIAGNHDIWMEKANPSELAAIIPPGITYLNDSGCEVEGLKFWGSPVQPTFFNWAFNRDRGEHIQQHWDLIPKGTDVLLTHGPVRYRQDECPDWNTNGLKRVGCQNLYDTVKKIKPILHICGHVHYGYGDCFNNGTTFINASVCNEAYEPLNKPYIVDITGKHINIVKHTYEL